MKPKQKINWFMQSGTMVKSGSADVQMLQQD